MQLYRLTLSGIGPFATQQEIDFTQLTQDGLFLLTGQTGAGKSTIIDAVVFALYGDVAGGDESDKSRLVSTFRGGSEPVVELIFETPAGLFKVRRTPTYERQRARGSGTTTQNATCKVWRMIDIDQEGADSYSGIQEANHVLARAIGLTKDQFTQTVVLPQGKFADFLRTTPDNRVAILQTIFGTQFYEQLRNELKALASTHTQALRDAETTFKNAAANFRAIAWDGDSTGDSTAAPKKNSTSALGGAAADSAGNLLNYPEIGPAESVLDPGFEEISEDALLAAFDASEDKTEFAQHRIDQFVWLTGLLTDAVRVADAAHSAVANELSAAENAAKLWREKQGYLRQQLELADREPDIAILRKRVQRATIAAILKPFQDAFTKAERQLEMSAASLAAARISPALSDEFAELPLAELQKRVTELMALTPELRRLAEVETKLTSAREKVTKLHNHLSATDQTISELTNSQKDLITKQGQTQAELDALLNAELELDGATRELDQATAQLTAHAEFTVLTKRLAEAIEEDRRMGERTNHAKSMARRVRERWLANLAGTLAGELQDSTPCPVCGSTEHPAPASPPDEDSTREAVDAADRLFEEARLAEQQAHEQVLRLTTKVDGHPLKGAVLGELQEAETKARLTREHAQARNESRLTLGRAAEKLGHQLAELTERLHEEKIKSVQTTSSIEELERDISDWSGELDGQLGGHSSIQARQQEHLSTQRAAENLLSCLLNVEAAQTELANRKNEFTGQLTASTLTEPELAGAWLPAETVKTFEKTIDEHEKLANHLARQLAREELIPLVNEPLDDLGSLRLKLSQAQTQRDRAIAKQAQHDRRLNEATRSQNALAKAGEKLASQKLQSSTYVQLSDLAAGGGANLKGITLPSYVLLQRFKEVIEAANVRLNAMTNGRYALEHTEERERAERKRGLGLSIIDRESDEARNPRTLSGGETFQASLALALGLADAVMMEAGGIELGTMFIDEGFGTLDDVALELVINQLGKLRDGGRVVGIISHVQELRRQIPNQIVVTKNGDGTSQLKTL